MKIKKQIFQPYDLCVFLFGLWNLLLFFGRGLIEGEYDWTALTALSVSVFYFALRELKGIRDRQMDILLILCSLLCELVLWHDIVNPEINFGLVFLIDDSRTLASFSLFVLCLSSAGYCRKQKKGKKYLYMVTAVLSSMCLFVSGEAAAVFLGGMVFLLIPLFMKPAAGRIRRVVELICMYLGLLSFLPLADFWLGLFRIKLIYTLEGSVYIYMIFSAAAVGFLNWRDKRKEEPGHMVKEFRKLCRYLLAGILTGLFLWDGLRESGTMAQCLRKYGTAGCVFFIVFLLAAGKRLYEKYLMKGSVRPVFGLVSIIYLIQSAFFPQQIVTALVYIFFLSTALQYKKREKRTEEYEKRSETKISKMDHTDTGVISGVSVRKYAACESGRTG